MKKRKILLLILISIFSLFDIFCIYEIIGYIILGIKTPIIYGDENAVFTGMYIMSLTYFIVLIITLTITIFCVTRFLKNKKDN